MSLEDIQADAHAAQNLGHNFPKAFNLYPDPSEFLTDDVQWGMTIEGLPCTT